MKKIFCLLFSFFIIQIFYGQTTLIPDANFEQALIDLGYDTGSPDGSVPTSNIANVITLNVSNKNINDLTGIEDFTDLEELSCSFNVFYFGLDVSHNVNLRFLDCNYSGASNLDLSNNPKLEHLNCQWDEQTNLDLSNNPELTYLSCGHCSITDLDLSNNPKLGDLYCQGNKFTQIDLSANPGLTTLDFSSNNILSIDLSGNTKLRSVNCGYTPLTTLDLSIFPDLYSFSCYYNSFTDLDFTYNPNISNVSCQNCLITSLDLSGCQNLSYLNCSDNTLNYLNIKNGNNTSFTYLNTSNNPNLSCIIVDDQNYSQLNWVSSSSFKTDDWTAYSNNSCDKKISGTVYFDENNNCVKDDEEKLLSGVIIELNDNNKSLFGTTNVNGHFEISVDTNTDYHADIISYPNMDLLKGYCPSDGYTINSGPAETSVGDLDFGLDLNLCPVVSADISVDRLRRCFRNNATITYKNDGPEDLLNAEVYIDFPEYVKLVSASENITLTDAENDIYMISIDTIHRFSSGKISLIDSVVCGMEEIRGYTQCIKTWITPKLYCTETKDTTGWDKSSIKVPDHVYCDEDSARFTIVNCGRNMQTSNNYRLYYNNELAYTGTFRLNSGDSLKLSVPADGSTIRLEADQHPKHPGKSRPRASVEGCGTTDPQNISSGFILQAPKDDLDMDVSEKCLIISDSYDPNDKEVSPAGITENHYVPEDEPLYFTVQFQNTGTDTAYKVVIVDTLSNQLDISTLYILGSSHNMEYQLTGDSIPVLEFTFENIDLPDSNVNEMASHGYVSFFLNPSDVIVPGTTISNFADIFFDFNSAIRTDTTMVTALDTTLSSNKSISIKEIQIQYDCKTYSSINIITSSAYTSPSGMLLTSGGLYNDTVLNHTGCDSIISINLQIKSPTYADITASACNYYVSPSKKYVWANSGQYADTISNHCNSDSIITINLTVNNSDKTEKIVVACKNYLSTGGKYYDNSGTYYDTLKNTSGCDSIIKTILFITSLNKAVSMNGTVLVANSDFAQYQWLDCNNGFSMINGATTQYFKPVFDGKYAVQLIQDECIDTSACMDVIVTGINENSFMNNIVVFPNPVEKSTYIVFDKIYNNIDIEIQTLSGQVIYTNTFYSTNKTEFEIPGPSGYYIVSILTGEGDLAKVSLLKK